MFCCKSATAIAQDCMSLPSLILVHLPTFSRSTLCISVVFAVIQCSSIHLSVTFVYCIKTAADDVVRLLSHSGCHIIPIAQFAITINSNVCPHIWVLNTLMRESYA